MPLPTTVTVTLDWNELGYRDEHGEPMPVEAAVVERTARLLFEECLKSESYRGVLGELRRLRDEVAREAVREQVEQALAGAVQRTNEWGDPVGESVTLRELVMKEAQDLMTRKDGGDYRREGTTLLQRVVKDTTEAVFRKELADALTQVKAQLSGIITERAASVLSTALVEATGDRSLAAQTAVAVTRG